MFPFLLQKLVKNKFASKKNPEDNFGFKYVNERKVLVQSELISVETTASDFVTNVIITVSRSYM